VIAVAARVPSGRAVADAALDTQTHVWPDSLVVLDRSGRTSERMFREVYAATEAFAGAP